MFGERWARTVSQGWLEWLEEVVRLLGRCSPPTYLYFLSLPHQGWDRQQVSRQARNLNLAEVVIAHSQDLPGETTSDTRGLKVRSLSSLHWLKISSVFRRELQLFQPDDNTELEDLTKL